MGGGKPLSIGTRRLVRHVHHVTRDGDPTVYAVPVRLLGGAFGVPVYVFTGPLPGLVM